MLELFMNSGAPVGIDPSVFDFDLSWQVGVGVFVGLLLLSYIACAITQRKWKINVEDDYTDYMPVTLAVLFMAAFSMAAGGSVHMSYPGGAEKLTQEIESAYGVSVVSQDSLMDSVRWLEEGALSEEFVIAYTVGDDTAVKKATLFASHEGDVIRFYKANGDGELVPFESIAQGMK